jgi:RNA polymerase sigma factor (sigma-70 family)
MGQTMEIASENRPDSVLLTEFAATHGEPAFIELVRRHGKLVFSVCYRVLGHTEDAEDAAQATFVTLARKAATLKKNMPLAGWLHTVAWRISLDARKLAARRRQHEQEARLMASEAITAQPTEAGEHEELRHWLDEAIEALPDKYRLPILLHYFEGRTKEETAELLGAKTGTIAARLDRGRNRLRDRLARRGLNLSVSTLATALAGAAVSAIELPADFAGTTAKAASLTAAGKAVGGLLSSQVEVLSQGIIKSLWIAKATKAAITVAAAVIITGGAIECWSLIADSSSGADRGPFNGLSFVKPGQGSFAVGGPAQIELEDDLVKEGLTCRYLSTGVNVSQTLFVRKEQYRLTFEIGTTTKPLEKADLSFTVYDHDNQELTTGKLPPGLSLKKGESTKVELQLGQNPTGRRVVIHK